MNNLMIYDYLYRLKNYRHNQTVKKIQKEISAIDSIMEYDVFAQRVASLISSGFSPLNYKRLSAESLHYGHLHALSHYAGIEEICSLAIYIEHGVNFSVSAVPDNVINNNTVLLFQSSYKSDAIHSVNPLKPVFSIGPLIHYAQPYYSTEIYNQIKTGFGRTAIIYPSHTYEDSQVQRDYSKFIDTLLMPFYDDYDTILVSVYWHDVNDRLFKELAEYPKVKLVSAGIRLDPNFISRTKSLLMLSDVVICNDIGTFVGYAKLLGKPVICIDTGEILFDKGMTKQQLSVMQMNKSRVRASLSNIENNTALDSVLHEFWGYQDIRKPEEIKAILELSNEILKESKGNKDRFDKTVQAMLKERGCKNEITNSLLFKAIGKGN